MAFVNGFKNSHALWGIFDWTGTIIATPEAVYVCVKSACLHLSASAATSPTTASNFCFMATEFIRLQLIGEKKKVISDAHLQIYLLYQRIICPIERDEFV